MAKKKLEELQQLPANTILGNNTGSDGDITPLTIAQVNALLGGGSGNMAYQEEYDAAANSPDLDGTPSGIGLGYVYDVSVAGDFFTEAVAVGSVLIAKQANPTALSHWIRLKENFDTVDVQGLSSGGKTELETGTYNANDIYIGSNSDLTNADDGVEHIGNEYYFKKYLGFWHRVKKKSSEVTSSGGVGESVSLNKNIILITDDYTNNDYFMKLQLELAGFTVTFVDDSDPAPDDSTYDLAIISFDASAGTVGTKYSDSQNPIIGVEEATWDVLNIGTDYADVSGNDIDILTVDHPIMREAGITATGNTTIYDGAAVPIIYENIALSGEVLPLANEITTAKPFLLVLEKGQIGIGDTSPVKGRRGGIGLGDTYPQLNETGLNLFMALIKWGLGLLDIQEDSETKDKTVGIVVSDNPTTANDHFIKSFVEDLGYNASFIEDNDPVPTTGYDAFILSSDASSGALAANYIDVPQGCVVFEHSVWDDMSLALGQTGEDITQVNILTLDHPIIEYSSISTTGLTDFYLTSTEIRYETGHTGEATMLADSSGGAGNGVIFALEQGDLLHGGSDYAAGRRVAFGADFSAYNLTDEGKSLLEASIRWAANLLDPVFIPELHTPSYILDPSRQAGWTNNSGRAENVSGISTEGIFFAQGNSGMLLNADNLERDTGDVVAGNVYSTATADDPLTLDFTHIFVLETTSWTGADAIIKDASNHDILPHANGLDIHNAGVSMGLFSFTSGANPTGEKVGFILTRTGTTLRCYRKLIGEEWEEATTTITHSLSMVNDEFRNGDDGTKCYLLALLRDSFTPTELALAQSYVSKYVDTGYVEMQKAFWMRANDIATLWQDETGATAVTTTGQDVRRVDDKAFSARILTQDAINMPSYLTSAVNGRSALLMEDESIYSNDTSFPSVLNDTTTAFSIFLVFASDDNSSITSPVVFNINPDSDWLGCVGLTSTGGGTALEAYIREWNGAATVTGYSLEELGNFKIFELSWDGTTFEFKVDNVSQGTAAFSGTLVNNDNDIELGGDTGISGRIAGKYAEFVVFDDFDATRNTNVYNHLKTYYNL